MSDDRPRRQRPRKRGGRDRMARRAAARRHNLAVRTLQDALQPELVGLGDTARREQVDAVRRRANELTTSEDVAEATLDEIFGLGPLEPLLRDPNVQAIRIEGTSLFANGEAVSRGFRDHTHARKLLDRILEAVGADLDRSPDGISATMMDGSLLRACLDGQRLVVDIERSRARRTSP